MSKNNIYHYGNELKNLERKIKTFPKICIENEKIEKSRLSQVHFAQWNQNCSNFIQIIFGRGVYSNNAKMNNSQNEQKWGCKNEHKGGKRT